MPFLACLPLIEPDIDAVLALDQRCLGGLWTRSGYQKEIDSDCSDLLVLIASSDQGALQQRSVLLDSHQQITDSLKAASLAAIDPTNSPNSHLLDSHPTNRNIEKPIHLLGIGCLWAILEEAHITTLAIEPTCQNRRLGQLLLTELLLHGYRRGLTRATLEVRASNEKALSLYQKFSFKEAGQRKRYYADGESARILWRSGLQEDTFMTEIEQRRQEAIAHLTQNSAYSLFSV